jgi:hypothetical protein
MALLQAYVDGVWKDLPTPAPENYEPTYTHLERSYQDSTGYLHRDIVRRNRAKVICGWNYLTGDEMDLLQTLYDMDYFYLRYTDRHNNRVEKKMYGGPISGKAKFMDRATYKITANTKASANFIEY